MMNKKKCHELNGEKKRFESLFLIISIRWPLPVPQRIVRERGRERGRNSVHARLSKNRTTPSSNDSSFLFLFKMLFVPHWKRGGRSKKTRDHVSFSLNPQQDARVFQCIRRVGHCGGLSGNFRSWESYTKTLHSLFIQSSRYSRLWKYILSTCPPFRLFESVSRGHSLMKATENPSNLLSQLARLICTPSSRKRKFNLTKYRTFSNDPTKKIFGKQFEMGEISFGRKISVRKGRLSNSFPFRICFAKTRV